jgi:hypothetical protein
LVYFSHFFIFAIFSETTERISCWIVGIFSFFAFFQKKNVFLLIDLG